MKADATSIKSHAASWIRSQGPLITLVVLLIFAVMRVPGFRSAVNITNIGKQVSMTGVLAIGMAFVILSGGIDLSVGSIAALAALLAARCSGEFFLAPILIPLAAGVTAGAMNGVLITRVKIPPFTATLAMMLGVRGLVFILAGKTAVVSGVSGQWFSKIAWGKWMGVPYAAMIFAGILGVAIVISRYTGFGRSVYAVGGNEEAANMMGLRVTRCKMKVYMISGACAAIGGMMLASRVTSVRPDIAVGWELTAIAAVVISGISLVGGIGKIGHVLYGVLILGVIPNIINRLTERQTTYANHLITGMLLLAVVLIQSRIAKKHNTH
ncbi:MAG: ABC transporter permease [Phycisphaerales bacterium]|jgi:galactofuranose transport system permease protein|nr:ABC transporter permease [Phycisphaerales bacterium]